MKPSEKKLLLIAALVFVAFLVVRVLPMAFNYYRSGQDEIALLKERMDRYRTLSIDTQQWQDREQLKNAEIIDLQSWAFTGTDPNLVSSSVQRLLRQTVESSGVELREIGVARYNYVGDWLIVEQDANFSVMQEAILPFLNMLQTVRPRLQVTAFNLTRNRRQYTGSLTVVGFAKLKQRQATQEKPQSTKPEAAAPALGKSTIFREEDAQ